MDIHVSGNNAFGCVLGGKLEVNTVLILIQAIRYTRYSISLYHIIEFEKE